MKLYNKEKLFSIILSGFILFSMTGCVKEESTISNELENNANNVTINDNNDTFDFQQTEDIIDGSIVADDINVSSTDDYKVVPSDENLTKDEIILNYFNDATNSINGFLNSDNVTNAKAKCKEYFITFVDFIFYGGEIKNITFDELKDETKMQVINVVKKLDNLIMKKFPDYKETISESTKNLYDKASELLSNGKDKLEDYVIDKVGEDKYQEALDTINEIKENDMETWNNIKEYGSEAFDSGKEKVKTWYESFRNN